MKITIVEGNGRIGVYRDQCLVYEDDWLPPTDLLDLVGIYNEYKRANTEWLKNKGRLPHLLDQVEFKK